MLYKINNFAFKSTESISVSVLFSLLCVSCYGQGLNLDFIGILEVKPA